MADNDAVELVKQRINIVDLIGRYVPLRQMGGRYVAPCPFHQETKPSFNVTEDGRFHCFGCQKSGDIFSFWMEYHGVGFREALEQLAQEAGVDLSSFSRRKGPGAGRAAGERGRRMEFLRMYRMAQSHFSANMRSEAGAACRAYMEKRGISPELADRFGLGWAMDSWHDLSSWLQAQGFSQKMGVESGLLSLSRRTGKAFDPFRARLMFPIRNTAGETIAFGGRIVDPKSEEPKYINSHDSPIYKKGEHLYGLDLAGKAIRVSRKVFLTEGYMDVLTLHQYGYENAVGGLGTALTDRQVQRLMGYGPQVFLLYDGDNAGRKAALAACAKFLALGAGVRVILQPEGEDIDTLLRGKGRDVFDRLCGDARPGMRFCVETLRTWSPREALDWCHSFIRSMRVPELVSPSISYLSRWLDFDETSLRAGILEELEKAAPNPNGAGSPNRDSQWKGASALEREILRVAIRYPDQCERIRAMGGDILLKSPFARGFWKRIEEKGPNTGYELEGEARQLWDHYRGLEAPPCDAPEAECAALQKRLDKYFQSIQKSSLSAVLRESDAQGDFDTGLTLLSTLEGLPEEAPEDVPASGRTPDAEADSGPTP